ncbi:MAG TPA: hypothetical protein DEP84_02785 [Chloroflexi bacterium]|nr:hypothetical protein [Chloroflexota bacterium]
MHDGIELEQWVPTVTIITAAFISSARAMAQARGVPNYTYVVIPHPIANVDQTQLRERAQAVASEIARAISGA